MADVQAENVGRHDAKKRTEDLADQDLIEQFLRGDEIDSNDAFRALVERHGPMVLKICRRVLEQEADAEDAYQATFVKLARQGASIRNRTILALWLNEVAYRTATKSRINTIRRRSLESQSVKMCPSQFVVPDNQHEDAAWNELRPVLHDEVRRLPAKYRIPVILSYLEGRTNEDVAALLHWPVGTVKGRLSRARALLRSRLARRGMALSAAFLLTALADGMIFGDVVPPELVRRTLLYVQNANPQSAIPGSFSTPAQPSAQSSRRTGIKALALSVLQHPRLGFILLSMLSISTAIGFAIAIQSSGISSSLGSLFSAFSPGQSAGAPCH
jgi:RNA polymerase sigma factor (sigma-70 family)